MNLCVKFGDDRPSRLAAYNEHTHTRTQSFFFGAMVCISAAYAVVRCPSVRPAGCLSVCLSRSLTLSKRINISSTKISPQGSHTILVFHAKRHGNILIGSLTRASNSVASRGDAAGLASPFALVCLSYVMSYARVKN